MISPGRLRSDHETLLILAFSAACDSLQSDLCINLFFNAFEQNRFYNLMLILSTPVEIPVLVQILA